MAETFALTVPGEALASHAHHPELSFFWKYIWSEDHKTIAKQYLFTTLFFLLVGGALAMGVRFQLAFPGAPVPLIGTLLPSWLVTSAGAFQPGGYNGLVTMHATVMVFLVVMPLLIGVFGNLLIPLEIGMKMFRLPLPVWALFITAILVLLAVPVLSAAAAMLFFDLNFGTSFFSASNYGQPLLWQHLFWFFGHPEVYIMILPAMGLVSEILAVNSRKPIFGYKAMVFAMISIGVLGFIVWGHHMFVSGMNILLSATFSFSTMVIAVPSAIKTFNWMGTVWGGSIRFTTPMCFALAFVTMFVIGGLSGIYMAATPVDLFIHHTYFIVAHIHYVLFGGSLFGVFGAIYFWFPKMFGRMMNETWGKIHFALAFIFFNCTFFPMHNLGLNGMMRRIADPMLYDHLRSSQPINVFVSVSAFALGLSTIPFLVNFFYSIFKGPKAPYNPWRSTTLEWTVPSPPGHGNFETTPTVYHGPYEYSVPGMEEDYLPQNQPAPETARIAVH